MFGPDEEAMEQAAFESDASADLDRCEHGTLFTMACRECDVLIEGD